MPPHTSISGASKRSKKAGRSISAAIAAPQAGSTSTRIASAKCAQARTACASLTTTLSMACSRAISTQRAITRRAPSEVAMEVMPSIVTGSPAFSAAA
jgi:hypothetical protein